MLSPMHLQYLVGLCCLRRDPSAVDVTIGDMVLDTAAGKVRDVDVTVTITAQGVISAFKAYEVKGEDKPLDVVTVEQLCMKLKDMPSVTTRAIVSTSGFTTAAVVKAQTHDVRLFHLKQWTTPMAAQFREFAEAGRPADFFRHFYSTLLTWISYYIELLTPTHPKSFEWSGQTPIYGPDGYPHKQFTDGSALTEALLIRSTDELISVPSVRDRLDQMPAPRLVEDEEILGGKWAHAHVMDLSSEGIFLKLDEKLVQATETAVSGDLRWQSRKRKPEFLVLEDVASKEAFAGAAILELGNPTGDLMAFVFAPDSRSANVETIRLEEKHRNVIRQVKIRDAGRSYRAAARP